MDKFIFFTGCRRKFINRLTATVCLVLVSSMLAFAQTSRGTVSGVIKDQTGAVIPGAEVTLTNTDTTVARTATTNDEGFYRFDAVDLGNYSVSIAAPNFGKATKTGIIVNANQTSAVDADLIPGGQEVVVEVTGESGAQLQTEAPVRGGNISTRQITELPISGLNPVSLALTLPGVSSNRGGFGVGTFSVNGARGRSNNFLIDGTENNDISVAGQGFQITNQDAVQEVSVQTANYDSEFGRAGGAVVNVITRAGTSEFHGTASFIYDTSTDDALTAAQSRATRVTRDGATSPPFNALIVPAGTFGGPLFLPHFGEGGPVFDTRRDKNFFFVAYQEQRFREPGGFVTLIVPTAAGRAQLQQFAGNPNVAAYLAATASTIAPIANRTAISLDNSNLPPAQQTRGQVQNGTFFRELGTRSTERQFQIRTDHSLGRNDQLSFRYLQDKAVQPGGGTAGTAVFDGFDADFSQTYRNFLIAETHIFSSSLTNELRLAYNRIQLGFPIADASGPAGTLPQINISNLTSIGVSAVFPQGRTADNYQVQDTVTKILGDHTIRGGIDYTRQISTQVAPANIRGSLAFAAGGGFTSLGNFVDNFGGSNGAAARTFGSATYNPSLHRIAGFVQDRYKATTDLTLTAGVRYEYFGVPFNTLRTPSFTGLFNVDPVTRTGPFSQPNKVAKDTNNFSPSVGFAYSPSFSNGIRGFVFGEKKTVIRAGYNIGYDSFFNNIASNAVASSPNTIVTQTTSTVSATNPRGLSSFSDQFPTVAAAVTPLSAQTLIAPNLRNPYYQRYSLGLQRELPFNIVMDISYVGSKGTNLYINEDYNPTVRPELRITPPGVTTGLSGRFDNLQGPRTVRTNGGDSNYNAGQIEVRRRFSNNFQITGAYTFSKLISNADEVFIAGLGSVGSSFSAIPAIFGGERNDRALSVFDRTHRATFTYVAQSPFFKEQQGFIGRLLGGFQLSGVTTFESGVPFSILNGFDSDGIGGANRPTFNPNGQRGVRAIPVVNANNFITGYLNPEVIIGRTSTGAPIFQPIDPNTAQFIVNPTYVAGLPGSVVRQGNLGRNTERSKGIRNFDMTLLKRTRVSERVFIEARIEAFNVFNHPQFGSGDNLANDFTQGLFLQPINPTTSGVITSTSNSGGRSIRYQAKFIF
jgi:outer membrane receptor protein involved in Fe transport